MAGQSLWWATLVLACSVDVPGFVPGGSGSGGLTTSGGDSTTGAQTEPYVPDQAVCVAPECITPADCCQGLQPSLTTGLEADDKGCPSDQFPNNWSCVTGNCPQGECHCVHGGCTADSDCNVYETELECKQVGSIGHCVLPCNPMAQMPCPDLDGSGSPDMLCTGEADDESMFCVQSLS